MALILDTPWAGQTFVPPTPLDIATIESAIVAHLQNSINVIEIVHFPDRPEAYRLTHRIGAALVSYRGSSYGELTDSAAIVQPRKLEFEVQLMARDLGWAYGALGGGVSPGAYALLEAVRGTLTGFQVPGCRKMYPLKERFIERDAQGGVWIYAISFVVETVAIEIAPPFDFPLFIRGLAQDSAGETVAAVGAFQQSFDAQGVLQLPYGDLANVNLSDASSRIYVLGIDYEVDCTGGAIRLIAGGALAPGASVTIRCGYDPSVVIA